MWLVTGSSLLLPQISKFAAHRANIKPSAWLTAKPETLNRPRNLTDYPTNQALARNAVYDWVQRNVNVQSEEPPLAGNSTVL